jgi:hypothetical protein
MHRHAVVLFACLFAGSARASDAPALPSGWRALSLEESQVGAHGDVNGDGRVDLLRIAKSNESFDEALLVWLSHPDGTYKWVTLTRIELKRHLGYPSRVFISGPGKHTVMCIQTRDECVEPPVRGLDNVTTTLPVVYYSALENGTGSGAHLFYWDTKTGSFIHGRQGD